MVFLPTSPRPVQRTIHALALAAALALSLVAPVTAAVQPAGYVPREQRNGAMKYWEAWAMLPADLSKKISDVDWDALKGSTEWDKLPESFKALQDEPVESVANAIENAAGYPRCNFELQWEDGVMTLMPHLSRMRAGARLMRVAARMDLAHGKADAAAHRTAIIFKTARDTSQDPVLISSLVGIAIADLAMSEVEAEIESGKLTAAAKRELLDALRAVNTQDPMNTRASIQGERDAFIPWIAKQMQTEETLKSLRELANIESGVKKEDADAYFGKLDKPKFDSDLKRIDTAYAELLTLWDKPDAKNELDAFSKKIDSGDYGTLARFFLPSIGNAKAAQDKFKKRLADTIDKVEKAPVGK